jgi:hypothetical protein
MQNVKKLFRSDISNISSVSHFTVYVCLFVNNKNCKKISDCLALDNWVRISVEWFNSLKNESLLNDV